MRIQTKENLLRSGTIFGGSILGYGLERIFYLENIGSYYEYLDQTIIHATIVSGLLTGTLGIRLGLEALLDKTTIYK